MIQSTQGIVLRSIKYGETSLVSTIFTRVYGVQTFLVQGVRAAGARSRQSRAGLLQPCSLLDLVVYHKPGTGLQRIREFQSAYLYRGIQEEVVRNSIALFSAELLLRLLPSDAPQPELFDFAFGYFHSLDTLPPEIIANFPLHFIVQCSRYLGYEIRGGYDVKTPYLNLQEGSFTAHAPQVRPFVSEEDAQALDRILHVTDETALANIEMNASMRFRLLEWFIEFLHLHTQHLGAIKSLSVLQAILH